MTGEVFKQLLFSRPSKIAREFHRPSNVLIIINFTRITNHAFPFIRLFVIALPLTRILNCRRSEDPSLDLRRAAPVNCLGSYQCTRLDYLGPVKPGLSIHTSTSYVPRSHLIGTLTPDFNMICGSPSSKWTE